MDDNEPEEKLLGRFRREVMRAGVIQECKRRRFFENKQDEKKRRTRDAAKRNRRRLVWLVGKYVKFDMRGVKLFISFFFFIICFFSQG